MESSGHAAQRFSLEIPVLLWSRISWFRCKAECHERLLYSLSPIRLLFQSLLKTRNSMVLGLCNDVRFDYSKMHVKAFGSPRLAVKSLNRFVCM